MDRLVTLQFSFKLLLICGTFHRAVHTTTLNLQNHIPSSHLHLFRFISTAFSCTHWVVNGTHSIIPFPFVPLMGWKQVDVCLFIQQKHSRLSVCLPSINIIRIYTNQFPLLQLPSSISLENVSLKIENRHGFSFLPGSAAAALGTSW